MCFVIILPEKMAVINGTDYLIIIFLRTLLVILMWLLIFVGREMIYGVCFKQYLLSR